MKRLIIIFLSYFLPVLILASDFSSVNSQGIKIIYRAISDTTVEVEVSPDCDKYSEVIIPDSIVKNGKQYYVTSIGEKAFYESGSEKIILPQTLKYIANYAFHGSTKLVQVTMFNGIDSIGSYAFASCWKLQNINLPQSVKFIGDGIFANDTVIQSISLSKSLKVLPKYTFLNCFNLKKIILSDSIEEICINSFWNNKSLERLVLPKNLRQLDKDVFVSCNSLKSLTFCDSIKIINEDAISNSSNIDSIICYAVVPPLIMNNNNLWRTKGLVIYVPCVSLESYKVASGWNSASTFKSIEKNCNSSINETSELKDIGFQIFKGYIISKNELFVYDISGKIIGHGCKIENLKSGVYIVRMGYNAIKIVIP